MSMFFMGLSLFGILVGVFLVREGLTGGGIGSATALLIGIFVVIKEIMDLIFAGK